jgi:hypothetical protein
MQMFCWSTMSKQEEGDTAFGPKESLTVQFHQSESMEYFFVFVTQVCYSIGE